MDKTISRVLSCFNLEGNISEIKQIITGHINNTYRVTTDDARKYTLQTINKYVFKHPDRVMANITAVTSFLKKKITAVGGDPDRECLTVIFASDGKPFVLDDEGNYWRLYKFIDNSYTVDSVENLEQIRSAGEGFGRFQNMLADFPMGELYDIIPDFHNTPKRYEQLMEAVKNDVCGRAAECAEEIEFFRQHYGIMCSLQGKLPLRVTHNDTKFNNILIDSDTNRALCVIDLDTVMPGYSVLDFGDAIRFAANTAEEDETDMSKIHIDMELYSAFCEGFLPCVSDLTPLEVSLMPAGAVVITLELASRFLADHINGDKYFQIHRPNHNLDRARCQIQLVRSMEHHMDEMQRIIEKYK